MAKKSTIDDIRARLAAIDIEADETERAPLAEAEIAARVDAVVARLAARAEGELIGQRLLVPDRRGSVDGGNAVVEQLVGIRNSEPPLPAAAMVAAMAPGELRKWLLRCASAAGDAFPPGLDREERAERLALLNAERRDLEAEEARLCWALEEQGIPAPWRTDQRPELVLGLES